MSTFRILSIDGGGIRGVIPAVWLSRITERVKTPLCECFDLVVGTSTGSIVAAAVALDKDIEQCVDLYGNFGPAIFPRKFFEKNGWSLLEKLVGPAYSDEPLEDALKQLFALDTMMGAAKAPIMIVSYDVFSRNMFLMKSYEDSTKDIAVWEACKASCSAPTYFPAHILQSDSSAARPLIDGGIFANNPSILALSEAIRLKNRDSIREFHKENEIVLVSLGTGSLQRRIKVEEAKTWGAIQWARPLIDVLFDSAAELSNFCARHIITTKNYVRMQVDLHGVNDDMDDASDSNINELQAVARSYLESSQGEEQLERISELLARSDQLERGAV